MIKKPLNLRRYITLYLAGLTLVLVIIYSLMLQEYMRRGMDSASALDLSITARDFSMAYQENPQAPLPTGPRLKSFLGPEKLPAWLKNGFPPHQYRHGQIIVDHIHSHKKGKNGHKRRGGMFFLYPYNLPDGRQLLLLKTYSSTDLFNDASGQPVAFRFLQMLAWPIGIGSVIFVVLAVRYMLHRLSRPVEKLGKWAAELSPDKIGQSHPDFGFTEVNDLADRLQDAMEQLQQAAEREHRFLRNASHELRTPIAVLSSNLELLERIRPEPDESEAVIYTRIRRAIINMNRLTQTLLWLNRDQDETPLPEPVQLDVMVNDLVSENRYLLKGKNVSVEVDAQADESMIGAIACHIALGNLIRNAFQYTAEGTILIRVRSNMVEIRNISYGETGSDESNNDYGFGLGLALVEQITERYGWQYENKAIPGGRQATVVFSQANPKENRYSN